MRPLILALAMLATTGCAQQLVNSQAVAFLKADLDSAAQVSTAGQAAGLLLPTDPWASCALAVSRTLVQVQASVGLVTPAGGLFTEAARLHILDVLSQSFPPELQAACGQVFFDLLLRAGKRFPGL